MPIADEDHAIEEVVERLCSRFPGVPEARVRAEVEARLATFAHAVVRDFVPVLVEHEVGEKLAGHDVGDHA